MRAFVALSVLSIGSRRVLAYDPLPRWGQAHALVNDVLFVHGGKTDQYNEFGYTSAPTNDDLLFLSLSNPFDPATPSWDYVGGSFNACTAQGPSVAWHSLSAFGTADMLLFGGIPWPGSSTSPTSSDSAALMDVYNRLSPSWNCEAQNWAEEPMRRMRHATASFNGKVYIIGGEKVDGSGICFSDHYIFDHSVPKFEPMTTTGGPSDICGHTTILLEDGRLLVFGGLSGSTLNSFATIWTLDATQPNASWQVASVSTDSLPSPRRAFAATSIGDGKVLIHGGSDASFQSSLSDGWILDTTKRPWTWTRINALGQLGPRRDHFAVHYGSNVVFGFGYAENEPANTTLSIYDINSGAFTGSYQPPPTPTYIQTLPGPTYTTSVSSSGIVTTTKSASGTVGAPTDGSLTLGPSDGHSASSTRTGSHSSSSTGSNSGDGTGLSDDNDKPRSHTAAIALGAIFGLLGLLVGAGLTHYYISRRRGLQRDNRFILLDEDGNEEDGSPEWGSPTQAAPHNYRDMAGTTRSQGLVAGLVGMVGLGTAAAASHTRQRRDILADEDASQYELGYNPYYDTPRRNPSGSTNGSSPQRRPTFQDFMHDSINSLRSVGGAMFAIGSKRSQEPSARSDQWDEKDPFTDRSALMQEAPISKAERPRGGRQMTSTSSRWSYVDPFSDPHYGPINLDEPYFEYTDSPVAASRQNLQAIIPPVATGFGNVLSPVSERPSTYQNTSDLTSSEMSHSHSSQSHSTLIEGHSSQSHSTPRSPAMRPSSMLDANLPPSEPLRRSESWWARFASKSLLDRRSSDASRRMPAPLPIRDPNPAPRLVAIEEASSNNSPESPPSAASAISPTRRKTIYASAAHGRSGSSLQTSRTADSGVIERVGNNLVVVQRESSGGESLYRSRHASMASGFSDSSLDREMPDIPIRMAPRALSVVVSSGSHESDPGEQATIETIESDTAITLHEAQYSKRRSSPPPPIITIPPPVLQASPTRGSPRGSAVAARVQAFERHAEATRSPTSPPPPGERSTWKTEHRSSTSPRPVAKFGLAQSPSLFVANPDRQGTDSSL